MTTERDLLRAIAREPDDDAPRLVYADWLDDAGDADRAEFIRGQIRLAAIQRAFPLDRDTLEPILYGVTPTWTNPGDSAERRQIAYRCRTLLDAHEKEWLRSLHGMGKCERVWSRGFVEAVDASVGALKKHGQQLFDLHPIRHLMLNGLGGKVDVLDAIPLENGLRALDLFASDLDRLALKNLAIVGHPGGLSELSFLFNRIDDSAIDFLCGDRFFQRLTLLRLGCNPFTEEGRTRLRHHFGNRVCFDRVRHPDRLLTFRTDEEQCIWAGLGSDLTQVLILDNLQRTTLARFDFAGDLLSCESCYDEGKTREAWLTSNDFVPATIKVKRLADVSDFPRGWADSFDCQDLEPEEYTNARDFINRWLAAGRYRVGACCGGWWYDGKTGERVGDV